jgi:hypothetical protein
MVARAERPLSKTKMREPGVAAKLQDHGREQHGFSRARRTDDERVAHIPDVSHETKRGCAVGARHDPRWSIQMVIPLGSRPHSGKRD